MPLALGGSLCSTSRQLLALGAALTRAAGGTGLQPALLPEGIPLQPQQPGSSAFLHGAGGLVSRSAGTHPALRPQRGK